MNPILDRTVQFLKTPSAGQPAAAEVVEALLQMEKAAKQAKTRYTYAQLLGGWRLGFVTGTKRVRQRAGIALGAGRFLPRWVKIQLAYAPAESATDRGTVQNSVRLGLLQLTLSGPTQFWPKANILAFDFTRMNVSLAGLKLYDGKIRGGTDANARFYEKTVKEQPFFTYFLIDDRCIAARGRGGGLALWTREV